MLIGKVNLYAAKKSTKNTPKIIKNIEKYTNIFYHGRKNFSFSLFSLVHSTQSNVRNA